MPFNNEKISVYVISALSRYWPKNGGAIAQTSRVKVNLPAHEIIPPKLIEIPLPKWAEEIGVEGRLLIPSFCLMPSSQPEWQKVDWLTACFWYLNGLAEREFEQQHGPIHSYSFRLKGWDARMWTHAWVNRIALFLRRWASTNLRKDENLLFGNLPNAEIILTHDVDAIEKTMAIRFKQSALNKFKAFKSFGQGDITRAIEDIKLAFRFFFSSANYWNFNQINSLEEKCGIKGLYFVYAGQPAKRSNLTAKIINPGYYLNNPDHLAKIKELLTSQVEIGLHTSFDAWRDADSIAKEKNQLEKMLGLEVEKCRQHWLRFSWQDTWLAQQTAGLKLDATLGFNDRPGFRNSAVLQFKPWDFNRNQELQINSLPLILMDSHLFDYNEKKSNKPEQTMKKLIDEINFVKGTGTFLWHPHVLSEDYGWGGGFQTLIKILSKSE